jgi:hypothetical protein
MIVASLADARSITWHTAGAACSHHESRMPDRPSWGEADSPTGMFESSNISDAEEFPGAKLGANSAWHRAIPSHIQPELLQVDSTPGDAQPPPATEV